MCSAWLGGDPLSTHTSGEEFGNRCLATPIKKRAAFANFILEHRFGEPQCKDYRLPRVNAKDPSLVVINKSFEANRTTPVIAIRLRSANRYMNRRFALCAASHHL
jgi:hypothetical protein